MKNNKKLLCVLLVITFLTMPLGINALTPIDSTTTMENSAIPADDEYNFAKRNDPISVLVYNEYADLSVGGEWDNVMSSLEAEYGYTFDYWNLTDYSNLDGEFIQLYDVLIIVEQEDANYTQMDTVAAAWSGFISDWVLDGGVVVCMSYWEENLGITTRILNGTGLMTIYNPIDQAYSSVTVTDPNDPLAFGVSAHDAADGSISFDTPDANEVIGTGGHTVVAHRYLGLGHVVMLGFDMFEIEGNQTLLLTNSVRLTRLAVFDNSHAQIHNPFSGYNTFATYIQENFGFAIATMNTWTPSLIETCQVFVAGCNYLTVVPFNTSEVDFVSDFVASGGGLLIFSEIWWYGNSTDPLLTRFGYERNQTAGFAADTDDNEGLGTQPIYGADNIANHSATIGVSAVQMYGSSAFTTIPDDATPLIWADTDGTAGWNFSATFSVDNSGYSLATSKLHGNGRIVTVADNSIFHDTDADTDGSVDFFDYSNEEFASSIMVWLSASGIVEKTVLMEESHNPYASHVSLNQFTRFLSFNGFNVRWITEFSEQLMDEADVLFIMSGLENYTTPEKVKIYDFVARGGGLFMLCDWIGYQVMTNDIISEFGMEVNGTSYLSDDDDGWLTANSYIAYSGSNIGNHPILSAVHRVEIDRGPGFSSIGSGTALVTTDDDGTSHWYNGGSADAVPIIVANEYGMGRVVVVADINFLDQTDTDSDGYSTMYDSDNDILLANSFYWFIANRHPEVEVLSPNGGEVLSGTNMIEWTAADPNRDALTFDIMYSPDNGGSWNPVATGLTGDSYSWDTTVFDNGNTSLIRVIAFDGLVEWGDSSDSVFELNNTIVTPTGTNTGGGTPLDPTLLLIIGAAGLIIVIVIIIIMKKKK